MSTRLLFIFLLCFTALRGGAQQRVVQYKPFIDERPWHYGFQIGLHDQGLKLLNNGYINEADGAQWVGENDRQNFGFSVGVLGEWRFTRNLAFRVTPTLHFGSKHLTFRNMATKQELTQDMKTTYIAVPALVKVAGPRYNNFRPYVVGGLDVMYDLTSS
ncbi:MAG: PorT family protein, partial [Prevotellaceae bacterium]|nr:PorT family protein [Prevotellaceae bacterium]